MKKLKIGEIIKIGNKEYIVFNKKGSNGNLNFYTPNLIILKNFIKNNQRKNKNMKRKFKGIKLTNIKKSFIKSNSIYKVCEKIDRNIYKE